MDKKDTYLTIENFSEGLYKEKGSKFYGLAFPTEKEDEIKEIISDLKKSHHDARHWCYGFRLGSDYKTYRYSDDGEPSSTAGKPIFGQIQSFELTNILVVVVRYFGGTKLGVGGLITAYKEAARLALQASTIIEKQVVDVYRVDYTYEQTNEIMRTQKAFNLSIESQSFEEGCSIQLGIRQSILEQVLKKLEHYEPIYIKTI